MNRFHSYVSEKFAFTPLYEKYKKKQCQATGKTQLDIKRENKTKFQIRGAFLFGSESRIPDYLSGNLQERYRELWCIVVVRTG